MGNADRQGEKSVPGQFGAADAVHDLDGLAHREAAAWRFGVAGQQRVAVLVLDEAHRHLLQLLEGERGRPVGCPARLTHHVLHAQQVLAELVVEDLRQQPARSQPLLPPARDDLAEDELQRAHLGGLVDVGKDGLEVGLSEGQVALVVQVARVEQAVELVVRPRVLLVEVALEAAGDALVGLAVLEVVPLLAQPLQHRLEQQEGVPVLRARQQRDRLAEGRLVLVRQRLPVLQREVAPQVLVERGVALLDALLPELALQDLPHLLLVGPRRHPLPRTPRPLAHCRHPQQLLDLGGRAAYGEVGGLLGRADQLRVQLRVLVLQLPHPLLQLPSVLPLDPHLPPQTANHRVLLGLHHALVPTALLQQQSLSRSQHLAQLRHALGNHCPHLCVLAGHHASSLPQGVQLQPRARVQQAVCPHHSVLLVQRQVLPQLPKLSRQGSREVLRQPAQPQLLRVPAEDVDVAREGEEVLGGDVGVRGLGHGRVLHLIGKYQVMVETAVSRLVTWKRRHPRVFPYGSSIVPLILTVLVIETPSLLLTCDLVIRAFLPTLLVPLLLLLQFAVLAALFICVYTDPGILPQIIDKYSWDQEQAVIPAPNHLNVPEHKYLMVTGGLMTPQKYCVECYIYRPLRAIHCQVCNHCVERYDHHCPWLGVCIGKRNYRAFIAFIALLACLAAAVAATATALALSLAPAFPLHSYLLEIIVAGTAGVFFLPIFKLLTYHLQLFHRRQTTNEDLKGLYRLLQTPVPFPRCQNTRRAPLVPIKANMILNEGRDDYRSSSSSREHNLDKGKRYSTLVSDRQSVLNYLVEAEL